MNRKTDENFTKILEVLFEYNGLDFSLYKEGTLRRRIDSRLRTLSLSDYEEYLNNLKTDESERIELINSIAINVTEFFRNPEIFEVFKEKVIPQILFYKTKKKHHIIKVWSCGCSSGDEPYSASIILKEKLGKNIDKFLIKIIGTDIDNESLRTARNVTYLENSLKALDGDLLQKYFEKKSDEEYKLKFDVSSMVKFLNHDVVMDKPIVGCDVILCRNLLIYFNKELQEEILLKFNECLNPGGFLILGMMESLKGSTRDMFEKFDNKLRIYRKPDVEIDSNEKFVDSKLSQEDIDSIVNDLIGET